MLFKQIFKNDPLLIPFMEDCQQRNIANNNSIKNLKFDYFEHTAFFGGVQDNKIKVFSGTHPMELEGKKYWRVGFRGVSLYDDTFKHKFYRNFRQSSLCAGVTFVLAMKWVEHYFGPTEFIMTTNIEPTIDNGKSYFMDRMAHRNDTRYTGWTLLYEDITYLYSRQNVWAVDKETFYSDFDKYHRHRFEFQTEVI